MDFLTKHKFEISVAVFVLVLVTIIAIILKFSLDPENYENTLEFFPVKQVAAGETYRDNDTEEQDKYVNPVSRDDGVSAVDFSVEPTDIVAADLLPKSGVDTNFSAAPGAPDLSSKNFLVSGFNIGINTQGSCNKNANRQLRSDPVIPVNLNATPFNQSTNVPDFLRKPLEIGSEM